MNKEKAPEAATYQLSAGLQTRQFGLDHGIYDHETRQIYMLNPIAGLILNYLFTGKSHDEIVENIVIACGKNTTKPAQIKKDLEKTVKELISLKLVEPVREMDQKVADLLIITENEMTALSIPYLQPQVKAYRMEELLKKYQKNIGDVRFCDTWAPLVSHVSFLDTWAPDKDPTRLIKLTKQPPVPGINTKGLPGKK